MLLALAAIVSSVGAAPPQVLPPPQQVEWQDATFELPRRLQVSTPRGVADQVRGYCWILDEALKKKGEFIIAMTTDASAATLQIRMHDDNVMPSGGYALTVTREGIRVEAPELAGVFNAFATLSQMIEQTESPRPALPACQIRDAPAVPLRVGHIDLTCQQYTAAYVQSLMRTLAHYKVNGILMEYSDMFPFRRHKPICRPDAFSEKDVADILRTAVECNQEIIPFLQSLGHLEYVLHTPEYARLGARHKGYMYCPSSPETMPFVRELIDEILEQHPGVRRLHIGGDEVSVDRGGQCPSCDAYIKESGFSALYVNHYSQVAEYCRSKGVQPLMWSDMILQHPEAIHELPRGIAWVIWDYSVTSDPTPQEAHGAAMGKLDQLSAAYRRYFGKGIGLDDAEKRGGLVAFGHTLGFKSLGFEAFTAPAARCSGDSFAWPRFDLHMRNIRMGFLKAAEFGLPGTIVTDWSYRGSPHELCLAEFSCVSYGWNVRTPEIPQLLTAFWRQRYGINDPRLAETILALSPVVPATTLARPTRDNTRNAWFLSPALQLAQLKDLVRSPDRERRLAQHRTWLQQVRQAASAWREAASRATRNRAELSYWDLALSHIEHRLALLEPLARLASVAYADVPATDGQTRRWEEQLRSFEEPRAKLRAAWVMLYASIATPRHLDIQLQERFHAEREMAESLVRDVSLRRSAPATRP